MEAMEEVSELAESKFLAVPVSLLAAADPSADPAPCHPTTFRNVGAFKSAMLNQGVKLHPTPFMGPKCQMSRASDPLQPKLPALSVFIWTLDVVVEVIGQQRGDLAPGRSSFDDANSSGRQQ